MADATKVKILKLITGEELLGECIVNEVIGYVMIRNPVRVIVMPNKMDPKTPNVGFAPWADFSDQKEFKLDKAHIITIMEPVKEFINQYNGMFGGLVLPPSGIIK